MKECKFYPQFEPNQVLTAVQLNGLTNFLEQEHRLTRQKLIGIGIVCGLSVTTVMGVKPKLTLSKGCGITSEGYLIAIHACTLTRYRKYTDPVRYPLFLEDDVQVGLWELLPDVVEEENTSITDLTANFLKDKAVLLYLECSDVDLETCTGDDCDEKGIRRELCIKKLLIKKSDLTAIIKNAPGFPEGKEIKDVFNGRFGLPVLQIGRLNLPGLGQEISFDDLFAAYEALIKSFLKPLSKALQESYSCYELILKEDFAKDPFSEDPLPKLFEKMVAENKLSVQYFYDFMKELTAAYDEFKNGAFDIVTECCPEEGSFPKHLMLGEATQVSTSEPSLYRHQFIYSPIHSGQGEHLEAVQALFSRIVRLISNFSFPPQIDSRDVAITPSSSLVAPLGQRAISYYYFSGARIRSSGILGKDEFVETGKAFSSQYRSTLPAIWNYDLSRRCRTDLNRSYHAREYSKVNHITEPLNFSLDALRHFRIEGHIGKNYSTILKSLNDLKDKYNLPLKIIGLKLGKNFDNTDGSAACAFKDLEACYQSMRSELLCFLNKEIAYFSALKLGSKKPSYEPGNTGVAGILVDLAKRGYKKAEIIILDSAFGYAVARATPDTEGKFSFSGMRSGNYYMAVNIDGAEVIKEVIQVKENQVLNSQVAFEIKEVTVKEKATAPAYQLKKSTGEAAEEAVKYMLAVESKVFPAPLININAISEGKGTKITYLPLRETGSKNTIGDFIFELEQSGKKGNELEFAYEYFREHPYFERIDVADNFARDIYYPVSLISAMNALIDVLPKTIKNVNVKIISSRLKMLSDVATAFREQILDNLNDPDYRPTGKEQETITHLGQLVNLCLLERLKSLRETYEQRVEEIKQLNLLGNYILKHSGAEHIAGVEKGGTFILVYDDEQRVVADFALPYICCSDCSPITTVCSTTTVIFKLPKETFCSDDETEYRFILSPPGGVVAGQGVRRDDATGDYYFKSAGEDLPVGETFFTYEINDEIHELLIEIIGLTAGIKIELINVSPVAGVATVKFTGSPDDADSYQWDFGDGSDGSAEMAPEHIYTLTDTEQTIDAILTVKKGICPSTHTEILTLPATEEITIDVTPTTFCKDDNKLYSIIVNPAGGMVTGAGFFENDGQLFFSPASADVSIGTTTLTYTLSGKTATIDLTVLNPIASFEIGAITRPDPEEEPATYQVTFVNSSQNADTYLWKIGDLQSSEEKEPLVTLKGMKVGQEIKVFLTASVKDKCPDTAMNPLVIPDLGGNGCEMPDLSYPVEKTEVTFIVDFNKEGSHVEVTDLGDINTNIATVELKDRKTIVITPHDPLFEVTTYQFTYFGIDTRTEEECEGTITLFIPIRSTRYGGLAGIEERYKDLVTTDETIKNDAATVKRFFDNVNREYRKNPDGLMKGERNEVIIEAFSKAFDPLLKKSIRLEKKIQAAGGDAQPELIQSKKMTLELMNASLAGFLLTIGMEEKDIEATGAVANYLSSGLKSRIERLDDSSKTAIFINIKKIVRENRDKVVLTDHIKKLVG